MGGRDKQLVALFIDHLNAYYGYSYRLCELPDVTIRDAKAVDAIAVDSNGVRLAVEHTLLQPFSGEREDAVRFLRTAGTLDQRVDLAEPGWSIFLTFRVGSVPTGVDWAGVGRKLEEWFKRTRPTLQPGSSRHDVEELGFPLEVAVEKHPIPDSPGKLFVGREMPAYTVEAVLRTALRAKLPKLVAAVARLRLLLLELDVPVCGHWEVGETLDALRVEFPELAHLWAVWTARTTGWESENFVAWHLVWPLGKALRHQKQLRDKE